MDMVLRGRVTEMDIGRERDTRVGAAIILGESDLAITVETEEDTIAVVVVTIVMALVPSVPGTTPHLLLSQNTIPPHITTTTTTTTLVS